MWDKIISVVPDTIKSIFGIVDKVVVDKDKSNEIKLAILTTIVGAESKHWLSANAFSIAMLINYIMLVTLHLLDKEVPEWSVIIALVWLAGPLINTLSTSTLGKIMELAREYKENKKEE